MMRFLIFLVLFLSVKTVVCTTTKCENNWDITNGLKSGTNITFNSVTFTENDYYTEDDKIFGCICNVKSCVRKCCEEHQNFVSNENSTCLDISILNSTDDLSKVLPSFSTFNIINVPNKKFCYEENAVQILLDATEYDYVITNSGVLQWGELNYSNDYYCVANYNQHLVALVCVVPEVNSTAIIYSIGMIISMPFLLATFIVYALLPERNLHQNALMFYVITLFFSYVLLVAINLHESIDEAWCLPLGYSTLFFFMVSFFWMNVICLDIWFTFSGSRGFIGSKRSSERRRLLIYGIYAWGMPLLLCFIVLLIQTYTDENATYNPKIGDQKCFLDDGLPNLLYFYGEVAVLIIINIVLFAMTAHKIRQVKKQTKMLKQTDSQKHNYEKDKRKSASPDIFRFVLFVKLLLAMGVNWSMEIISWAVIWATGQQYNKIWYVTDFCNAAYGVFIFFIFVFKKKIWQLLQKRYYTFMGKPHLARTIVSTTQQTNASSGYSSADTHLTDRTDLRSSAGTHVTNGMHIRPEEVALQRIRSA